MKKNFITARRAQSMKIGIIGIGYIGTIITAVLASRGYEIVGIDSSEENVKNLRKGKTHVYENGLGELFGKYSKNTLFSDDYSLLKNCDVILVTVGTPLTDRFDADLSGLVDVADNLGKFISDDTLVCIKSTVTPGATQKFAQHLEERSGKRAGIDYFLAFSPERIAEGRAISEFREFPIVVGADDSESLERISNFWRSALGVEVIKINSYMGAEITKLASNLWIDLNIALANNVALVCFENNIDVDEVISAANSLPKGSSKVNILNSSIGVGGSCLTKDPIFFANLLDEFGQDSTLIRSARKVNDAMPRIYLQKVLNWIERNDVPDPKISLIGLAFKSDTNDLRYSPMIEIYQRLRNQFSIMLNDPHVTEDSFGKAVNETVKFKSFSECISNSDIVIVGCAHKEYTESEILTLLKLNKKSNVLFVDGRHAYRSLSFDSNINYMAI